VSAPAAADADRPGAPAAALLYAAVTPILTWPLLAAPGRAVSVRGDYVLNLWNFWWMRQVFTRAGASLYWTDALFHPIGVSLARHELSPLNAAAGALLSGPLDPHAAFRILVGLHFWLSAWTAFLFVRAVTGSGIGALLAGLFWSFGPFHFYYLAQLNVGTLEFLPLAGWWMVRSYREGGARNALGVGLAAGLLAASSSYYVVYAGLLGAALLLGGRLWAPDVRWTSGARRLALAALPAALSVGVVAGPLLAAGADERSDSGLEAAVGETLSRSNDLLGFLWTGPPENLIVTWPSMLGWSTLALAALGLRFERRRAFWLGLSAAFAVLSLGPELHVAGRPTELRLPYAWLSELPVLWMLRKPDRLFALVQLPVGVLLAFGWEAVAARLRTPSLRLAVAGGAALVLALERVCVPLETFPVAEPAYLAELAGDPAVRAVVHLPHGAGTPADARASLLQTRHGKAIPQGYVVDLALGAPQRALAGEWLRAYAQLGLGDGDAVAALARRDGIDRVLLHKTVPGPRPPGRCDGAIVWAPFALAHRELVALRQLGPFVEVPVPAALLARQQAALEAELGPPVYEDEALAAYRVPGASSAASSRSRLNG